MQGDKPYSCGATLPYLIVWARAMEIMMLSLEGYPEARGESPNVQSFSLYLSHSRVYSDFYTHSTTR